LLSGWQAARCAIKRKKPASVILKAGQEFAVREISERVPAPRCFSYCHFLQAGTGQGARFLRIKHLEWWQIQSMDARGLVLAVCGGVVLGLVLQVIAQMSESEFSVVRAVGFTLSDRDKC